MRIRKRYCVRLAFALFAGFLVLGLGIPAAAAVSSLLHMDGADGGKVFTDEFGGIWSAAGDAQTTTADAKFGGSSATFDGSGDSIRLADSAALFPGSAPFTIDFWVNARALGSGAGGAYLVGKSTPTGGLGYDIRLEGQNVRVVGVNGWGFNLTSAAISLNEWHHVALSCTADTSYLFVDGDLEDTAGRSAISTSGNSFAMGYQDVFSGGYFNGLVDEFRYVANEAVWTASFTPPNQPYAVPEPAAVSILFVLAPIAWLRRRLFRSR